MNNAKILTSIEDIFKYLKMASISFIKTYKCKDLSPKKYSDKYYQTFHDGNYRQTFVIAAENNDYDICLEDGSFFQFTATNDKDIHYSFFHKIEKIMSYEEYEAAYLTEENIDMIETEYEMYLSTDKELIKSCPIRYDVSESEYSEGTHAFAHLHIGIDTDIRIPVSKIFSPIIFVDFVIKHMYKEQWDKAYLFNPKFKTIVTKLKQESEIISKEFFTDEEKKLIFIG